MVDNRSVNTKASFTQRTPRVAR